ncbi:hypothetical protein [Geomesophilobacter sediminis]|uniref:Uncharacterized protein n=1 Tax=Geomesophilobacter sediminis TaxID=2798584 RepID=A0A8J7IQ11_9BACT|nr:hypothetical protein [Geomesophilobacter sediminis]MBJ6724609.1 hypothetical protein [Geomesophilobacter sediminis]
MKSILILLYLLVLAVPTAHAGIGDNWYRDGRPAADDDTRKTIDGFGAAVILTSDKDWSEKWNTPSDVIPRFTTVDKLHRGESATLLIFFANPKQDAEGNVDITCDVKTIRPDNRVTEDKGLPGFKGKIAGSAKNTFLTQVAIKFVVEPNDPLGEWTFEVTVHDNQRHVAVPLKYRFTLVGVDSMTPEFKKE